MEMSSNVLYEVIEKAKKYDELLFLSSPSQELHCSFCGAKQSEVKRLITGMNVAICSDCVDMCNDMIKE